MGASVSFDYATWAARYPEFSSVSAPTAQAYFDEATLYLANDGSGPVNDPTRQLMLLNMLTAHIAFLYSGTDGQGASPLVGRVSNASEGSVSVQAEMASTPEALADYFKQTKYGLSFWNASAVYRTLQYVPGPRRNFAPWPYGRW